MRNVEAEGIRSVAGAPAMKLMITRCDEFDSMAAQQIARLVAAKPGAVLGTATGSTTVGVHRELVRLHHGSQLDFARVTVFHVDEYVGPGSTHPVSCRAQMEQQLLCHVDIDRRNVFFPYGSTASLESQCRTFEDEIATRGGIDCQVLGIGANGHVGLNEPGTPLESTTHVADLSPKTIATMARCFASGADVPAKGITMGIKTIMLARRVMLLAKGDDKADIVHEALFGSVTTDVPASVLQLHPDLLVVLDEKAAARIAAR